MFEGKVKSRCRGKIHDKRVAGITFLRAPNLSAGIAVARKRGGTGARVTGCVNSALRLAGFPKSRP